jgi:hypothetical protein
MEIAKIVMLLFILSLLCGCLILYNTEQINKYISVIDTKYNTFNMNNTDTIQYIKSIKVSDNTIVQYINSFLLFIGTTKQIGGYTKDTDSTGLAKDSTGLAKDSTDLAKDSTDLAKDSSGLAKDSSGLAKDSSGLAKESTGLAKDSTSLAKEKDSTSLAKDSTCVINDNIKPIDIIDLSKIDITKSKYHGEELPWDREVGYCDILKNTDDDLYKTVHNTKTITFY